MRKLAIYPKIDPKVEKCIFIGYALNKKRYKCFNPQTKKTFVSMDVTFLETQPWFYKTKISNTKAEKFTLPFYMFLSIKLHQFILY